MSASEVKSVFVVDLEDEKDCEVLLETKYRRNKEHEVVRAVSDNFLSRALPMYCLVFIFFK